MVNEFGVDRAFNPDEIKKRQQEKEIKSQQEEIEGLKSQIVKFKTDPVTGLERNHLLNQKLKNLIEELNHNTEGGESSLFAVMVVALDLDDLRKWNKHGHKVGDKALEIIASSIKRVIKNKDHAFRRGDKSDEIVVVMRIEKNLDDNTLKEVIFERLQRVVNAGFIEINENGEKIKEPVTASADFIVLKPGESRSVDEILAEVDARQVADKENPQRKENRINKARELLNKTE